MRNKLRKAICAGLGLTQILSSGAFAMSDYKNDYKIDYMDRIFEYDTGDFVKKYSQSADLPKGEYDNYINLLKNIGVYSEKTVQKKGDSVLKFSDMYYAMSMVIYQDEEHSKQYDSTKFDQAVTMKDAISAMEDLLGYDKIKTEQSIMQTAQDEKLLTGLSYDAEREMTFGEFSRLLWNTLNAYGIEAKYTADGMMYEPREDTLLERQLEVYEIKGFMNAANGVNIYKNSALRKGYVEIDRGVYKADDSAANYLGQRVLSYVKEDDMGNKVILHIESDKSNDNITVDFKNIESLGARAEYVNEEDNLKRIDISDIRYVLYNGDATHDFSVMNNYENMDGCITFSKSKKNGEYDTAVITSYSYYVIHSVDEYEKKIYLKDGALFNGENYIEVPEDEYVLCTSDGEAADYAEFSPGDIIRVVQNSGKTFTRIDKNRNLVTGKVQSVDSDNGTVNINSKDYRVSKTYENRADSEKIQSNLFGVFYISSDGYIAGYKNGNEASYGYLRKVHEAEDNDEIVVARIFTQEGQWKDFELKDKLTLDGASNVAAKDVISYIRDNNMNNKLIRYKINAGEKITFLDTLIDSVDEASDSERLKESYAGTVRQSWQGGVWFRTDPGYRILNDKPVFKIPKNTDKTEEFKIMTGGNLNSDETDIYITLYSADRLGLCSVGVIADVADNVANESASFYCEKMNVGWDDEESAEIYELTGKRLDNNGNVLDYTLYLSEDKKQKIEDAAKCKIGAGTLLKMTYDSEKYIASANVIMTEGKLPADFYDSNNAYYQYMCGTVTMVDTEQGFIRIDAPGKSSVLSPSLIICIDSEKLTARKISTAELREGERMYAAKIGGGGRVCAVVR